MIMVTVTVTDHRGRFHTIGQMAIRNTGLARNPKFGDYEVLVANRAKAARHNDIGKLFSSPTRTGVVTHFPRLSYNVWRLVSRALRATFPEESH